MKILQSWSDNLAQRRPRISVFIRPNFFFFYQLGRQQDGAVRDSDYPGGLFCYINYRTTVSKFEFSIIRNFPERRTNFIIVSIYISVSFQETKNHRRYTLLQTVGLADSISVLLQDHDKTAKTNFDHFGHVQIAERTMDSRSRVANGCAHVLINAIIVTVTIHSVLPLGMCTIAFVPFVLFHMILFFFSIIICSMRVITHRILLPAGSGTAPGYFKSIIKILKKKNHFHRGLFE